jgi:hypothetical protein
VSTIAISTVFNPEVQIELDEIIEDIERTVHAVRASVIRERAIIKFFFAVRGLNAVMSEFIDHLDVSTQELQDEKVPFTDADDGVDPRTVLDRLEVLYKILNGLYVLASKAGFKRKLLTKREVKKLRDISERVLDYVAWLEDVATQEATALVEAAFEEGIRDLESGDTILFS